MNRTGHLTIGFIFTIPFMIGNIVLLALTSEAWLWWMIPKYLFIWAHFSRQADSDHAFELPHRHWYFHSIIPAILFTIFFWGPRGTSFVIVMWSVHLLCDIYQKPGKKPVLGYLIHYRKKALNAKQTKAWLWANGLGGFVLGFLFDVIPIFL